MVTETVLPFTSDLTMESKNDEQSKVLIMLGPW